MTSSTPPDFVRVCPACGRTYPALDRYCATDGTPLANAPLDPLIGTVVRTRYRIARRLGRGGMGDVYLAFDVRLRRLVALKFVRSGARDDVAASQRLLREAYNAAGLDHPHVIRVYDLDIDPGDDTALLVMEYAPGPTLREVIADIGPMPIASVAEIVEQVASGLEAIHARGLVHRDLKPSNIVVTRSPTNAMFARILDFGIARSFDDPTQSITATGVMTGTLAFMSPEQLSAERLDVRADVFALTAVTVAMIAGETVRPSSGLSLSMSDIPDGSTWPTVLKACLALGLARDRTFRTATPTLFAQALRAVAEQLGAWRHERVPTPIAVENSVPTTGGQRDSVGTNVPITETALAEDGQTDASSASISAPLVNGS